MMSMPMSLRQLHGAGVADEASEGVLPEHLAGQLTVEIMLAAKEWTS